MLYLLKKHRWEFLLFSFSFVVFVFLIFYCRCTSNPTHNGLWKSAEMLLYLKQGKISNPEIANLYYLPFMGFLYELFSVEHNHVHILFAVINACFGAGAVALTFSVAKYLYRNVPVAALTALLQFSCGGFISLSTNCEDMMPAFFFNLLCLYFFLRFLSSGYRCWLAISASAFSLAMFFHWTIAPPLGLGLAAGFFLFNHRKIVDVIRDVVFFSVIVIAWVSISSLIHNVGFFEILYPGKGMGSLWVGWNFSKLKVIGLNAITFMYGGYVIPYPDSTLSDLFLKVITGVSAIYFLILVCAICYVTKEGAIFLRFWVVLLIIFLAGNTMNFYEQGYDQQFFIQPMFFIVFSASFLFKWLLERKWFSNSVCIVLMLLPMGLLFKMNVYSTNFSNFRKDDKEASGYYYFKDNLPEINQSLFVVNGNDAMVPWAMYLTAPDKFNYLLLPDCSMDNVLLTREDYIHKIDSVMLQYEPVLIDSQVYFHATELSGYYTGYNLTDKMKAAEEYFLKNYSIRNKHRLSRTTYLQIKRKL